jgi:hypothetical protein
MTTAGLWRVRMCNILTCHNLQSLTVMKALELNLTEGLQSFFVVDKKDDGGGGGVGCVLEFTTLKRFVKVFVLATFHAIAKKNQF